jgi:hypothetical protein
MCCELWHFVSNVWKTEAVCVTKTKIRHTPGRGGAPVQGADRTQCPSRLNSRVTIATTVFMKLCVAITVQAGTLSGQQTLDVAF